MVHNNKLDEVNVRRHKPKNTIALGEFGYTIPIRQHKPETNTNFDEVSRSSRDPSINNLYLR
jgi:hypothetical protein